MVECIVNRVTQDSKVEQKHTHKYHGVAFEYEYSIQNYVSLSVQTDAQ